KLRSTQRLRGKRIDLPLLRPHARRESFLRHQWQSRRHWIHEEFSASRNRRSPLEHASRKQSCARQEILRQFFLRLGTRERSVRNRQLAPRTCAAGFSQSSRVLPFRRTLSTSRSHHCHRRPDKESHRAIASSVAPLVRSRASFFLRPDTAL